jgi:hypothetical protein
MEFTGVELACGVELAAPWRRLRQVGQSELRAGEFCPSHDELGRRSARCVRASSAPAAASWATSALAKMSAGGRGEHEMSAGGGRPGQPP